MIACLLVVWAVVGCMLSVRECACVCVDKVLPILFHETCIVHARHCLAGACAGTCAWKGRAGNTYVTYVYVSVGQLEGVHTIFFLGTRRVPNGANDLDYVESLRPYSQLQQVPQARMESTLGAHHPEEQTRSMQRMT